MKIKLSKTHTLLYREAIVTITFAMIAGLGLIILPDTFFYSSKTYPLAIGQYIPAQIWGGLWLLTAIMMVSVFGGINYKIAQIGMIIFSSLCIAWSIGLVITPFFNSQPAFLGAAIWALGGIRTFILAFEPPINPATAIRLDDAKDAE